MSGQRRGAVAAAMRALLRLASGLYGWAVNRRNRAFDSGRRRVTLIDRPVISIGNITTGGTGKTPVCIWLASRLAEWNRRPGIISRGYGAARGAPNDEMQVVSRRAPQCVCVSNPDRAAAAELAVEEYGADVIIMDDGFQHRFLARDLDILVIDATRPFGFDHLLPRGLLREPLSGLARADLFVVTRADLVADADMLAIFRRLQSINPDAPIVRCRHHPTGFASADGQHAAEPDGSPRQVFITAGIGNPRAFAEAIIARGYTVVGACWWPDHHDFRPRDARYVVRKAQQLDADAVFTTEKDLVKLQQLEIDWPVPLYAATVDIAFIEDDETVILERVRRMLDEYERDQNQTTEVTA